MSSLWGFRCDICRAEFLVKAGPGLPSDRTGWSPPVLCCGRPLRRLEVDQVLLVMPSQRRAARCPRCGYQVRLVVHPAGSLVCLACQTDLLLLEGTPDRTDRASAPVTPTAQVR
jgi:DNA-directed RNA polymerase subunit RPC12/RpoP